MRAHESKILLLLALLAAIGAPVVAAAAPEDGDDAEEYETDDLPPWAELDAAGEPSSQAQVQMLRDYGTDIPDPEDVMAGRRPRPPSGDVESLPAEPRVRVEFEDFRSELSPHGRWVDTPEYGTVFIPHRQTQVPGWRPYLYGQWAWTAYGWTWVSDEPFGWATYHYGRWAWRPALGWVWVPGYTWGPAWVVWRYGAGAIGWAPLYPGYVTWSVSYPYYADHWIFVGHTYFYTHPIHRHWHRGRSAYWYGRTDWSRNWRGHRGHVYVGPRRRYVERVGRARVVESRVIAVSTPRRGETFTRRGPGTAGEVRIYRPTNRGARAREVDAGRRPSRIEPRSVAGNRLAPAERGGPRAGGGSRAAPGPRGDGATPAGRRAGDRLPTPPRAGGGRPAAAQKPEPRPGGGSAPAPGRGLQAPARQAAPQRLAPAPSPGPRRPAASPGAMPRKDLRPSGGPYGGLRPTPSMPAPKRAAPSASGASLDRSSPPPKPSVSRASTSSVNRSSSSNRLAPSASSVRRPAGPSRVAPSSGGRSTSPRPAESPRGGGRPQR
ncbi:MAG TPA: DUF6600 domain-containing protein [Vulgatibacter sp.]|nr:DUF6600 domain-containing protein [Vulgatibacter sp.]